VNKKALIIILTLLALPILTIMPVEAGKGQEKLYYEANVVIPGYIPVNVRTVPPETTQANVVFMTASGTATAFTLQIGSEVFYPNHLAEIQVILNVAQNLVLLKISETYSFDDVDGTLEISATGRINNYGAPDAMSDVTVVGHGTGYFKGVKISAHGGNEPGDFTHKIHIGTIMGWPGLPP
jgi:hypothetical protein